MYAYRHILYSLKNVYLNHSMRRITWLMGRRGTQRSMTLRIAGQNNNDISTTFLLNSNICSLLSLIFMFVL